MIPAASQFLFCEPPDNGIELDIRFKSGQTYSVKKSRGDYTIHNHPMSALKTSDRCLSLWPDNSINYALIVAELTQAALYRCNRCNVVSIPRLVVRVTARITPIVRIRVVPVGGRRPG